MNVLLTGVAGFIGNRTARALLDDGIGCRGVDCLTSYYSPLIKTSNIADLQGQAGFEFVNADLRTADLEPLLDDVDVVVHLAAQPGVRASWSEFSNYVEHNVLATHRLLEAACGRVERFVYASSSSVYGDSLSHLTPEDHPLTPRSPYGATKLGGEHLCDIFAANYDMPTVMLRYFTVFGPGQRPDMAMHRLIEAAQQGSVFPMYGSGKQVRDFTYVDDVVKANCLAMTTAVAPGTAMNVAGGTSATLNEVVESIEELTGRQIIVDRQAAAAGDVKRTSGSTESIRRQLGWTPDFDVVSGLREQIAWHVSHQDLLAEAS